MKISNAIKYLLAALLICWGNSSQANKATIDEVLRTKWDNVFTHASQDLVLTAEHNQLPQTKEEMKRKVRIRIRHCECRYIIAAPAITLNPIFFFENSGQSLYQSYRICDILFGSDLRGPPARMV